MNVGSWFWTQAASSWIQWTIFIIDVKEAEYSISFVIAVACNRCDYGTGELTGFVQVGVKQAKSQEVGHLLCCTKLKII